MALYMDRHYVEDATRSGVAQAHDTDLAIQEKYPVKFLTYWFDEPRCTGFCLIESPDKESIQKAHHEAHGLVPIASFVNVEDAVKCGVAVKRPLPVTTCAIQMKACTFELA